jgi:hypothetical protein
LKKDQTIMLVNAVRPITALSKDAPKRIPIQPLGLGSVEQKARQGWKDKPFWQIGGRTWCELL